MNHYTPTVCVFQVVHMAQANLSSLDLILSASDHIMRSTALTSSLYRTNIICLKFQAIGNRLARLLRTSAFTSSVPDFISITQTRLHELACLPSNSDNTIVFDPFDHIYSLIFNLT